MAALSTKPAPAPEIPPFVFWAVMVLLALEYLGLPADLPILRITKFATLTAYGAFAAVALAGGLNWPFATRQGRLLLGLFGMAAASILYAVVKSYVPTVLRQELDYLVLFVLAANTMDRRTRITRLSLMGTLIILILVGRNLDILTSGVRAGTFKAGTFMGDGNDFAWGLIALMPLPLFLLLGRHGILTRAMGLMGFLCAVFGVVGTQSRGATLAVVTAGLYYWLALSKRRVLGLVVMAMIAGGVALIAPSNYFNRLETNVETDSSAQGRLRAWGAAFQMAKDFPLGVGVGSFNSAYGRYYMAEADEVFDSRRWISAHSIYFKVLGESGFLGLLLVLAVLWVNLRDNSRALVHARDHPDRTGIEDRWPALLNFGLIGYAVAGAFLGGLAYPHLYLLSGLIVGCQRMTLAHQVQTSAATVAASVPARRIPAVQIPPPRPRIGSVPRPGVRV